MGIDVGWDTEVKHLLRLTYQQPWSWEQFKRATTEVDALFKSVTDTVDLLIDISNAGFPPTDALPHFTRVLQFNHPNRGIIAFVGAPTFVTMFVRIINRVSKGKAEIPGFQFFATIDAARQTLAYSRKMSTPSQS